MTVESTNAAAVDEWTSPRSERDVEALLRALPAVQRVVCMQTAAQLALPIWVHVSRRYGLTRTHLRAPGVAIDVVDRWLANHRASGNAMLDARQDAFDAAEELDASRITPAACAAFLAAAAVDCARCDGEVIQYWPGWAMATIAEQHAGVFMRWWARCEHRLAFADATTAELLL